MSRRRRATATAATVTPAVPAWRSDADAFDAARELAEVELHSAIDTLGGLRDAVDAITESLEQMLAPDSAWRQKLDEHAPEMLESLREAIAQGRDAARWHRSVMDAITVAQDRLSRVDTGDIRRWAADADSEKQRADRAEDKVAELQLEIQNAFAPEAIGSLLVECGIRRPAMQGWTRALVTETMQEIAYRMLLRR